jgi:hypothetical protein
MSLPKQVVVVSSKRGGGARLDQHRKGTGARLTQVVREAGISWVVARTWRGGKRLERKLKALHSGVFCLRMEGRQDRRKRERETLLRNWLYDNRFSHESDTHMNNSTLLP